MQIDNPIKSDCQNDLRPHPPIMARSSFQFGGPVCVDDCKRLRASLGVVSLGLASAIRASWG